MNIENLKEKLKKMGVSNELYYIGEGFPNEAYCLNKRNDEIEVYYSERGKNRKYRTGSGEKRKQKF